MVLTRKGVVLAWTPSYSRLTRSYSNLYALWVRDALEVAYDQVRCHADQVVRRQKHLYDKRAVKRVFAIGDWTMRYYYLVVSLAGWAVGVQLHHDSPIHMIHGPRGLVLWLQSDRPDPATTQLVIGASMVGQSTPGSPPSTVSGILSQQSLPQAPDTVVPALPPKGSICVDMSHVLHPFFGNCFDAGPV